MRGEIQFASIHFKMAVLESVAQFLVHKPQGFLHAVFHWISLKRPQYGSISCRPRWHLLPQRGLSGLRFSILGLCLTHAKINAPLFAQLNFHLLIAWRADGVISHTVVLLAVGDLRFQTLDWSVWQGPKVRWWLTIYDAYKSFWKWQVQLVKQNIDRWVKWVSACLVISGSLIYLFSLASSQSNPSKSHESISLSILGMRIELLCLFFKSKRK